MSGGSFNYLYQQDPYSDADLVRMAQWLRDHDMVRAANETLTFRRREADTALKNLWKAVEWETSADWSYKEVLEAHAEYTETRDRPVAADYADSAE